MSIYDSIRQEQAERYSTGGVNMSYYDRFANMDYDRFMSGGLTYGKSEREEGSDPWELKIVTGRHDPAGELNEDNYLKFAANQIEYLEERSGERMGANARQRFVDLWRQAATGDNSNFAVDHFKRARAKINQENPWASYKAGVMQSLGGVAESITGIAAPGLAERMREARQAHFGTPEGAAGLAGQVIGTAGQIGAVGAAAGTAGMVGQAAAQGLGGARTDVYQQRQAGEDISRGSEWGYAVTSAALEGVAGFVSAGIYSKMGSILHNGAPSVTQAYRLGGERAAAGALTRLLRAGGASAQEAGEEALTQIAGNALAKAWGVDEDRSLYQGATEAALMGALVSPFVGAAIGRKAEKALQEATDAGTPPVPGTYPAKGEMDQLYPVDEIPKQRQDMWMQDPWSDEAAEPYSTTADITGEMTLGPGQPPRDMDLTGLVEEGQMAPADDRRDFGTFSTGWARGTEASAWASVDRDTPGMQPRPGWSIGNWMEDLFTPISHRVELISRTIAGRLARFEGMTRLRQTEYHNVHKEFFTLQRKAFKKSAKPTKELHRHFDNAVMNGDFETAENILRENAVDDKTADALVTGMNAMRDIYARLRKDAIAAGVAVGDIPNYWPRSVKNHDDYMRLVDGEVRSVIDEKIREFRRRKKRAPDKAERTELINAVMQNHGPQGFKRGQGAKNLKQRRVDQIEMQNQSLYHGSAESSYNYIARMVEVIEAAKFFGRQKSKLAERVNEEADIPFDMESSVGEFVDGMYQRGEIDAYQQDELIHLLNARFVGGMRSPNRVIRTIRDLGYMTTLSNPLSALVQLGDIAMSSIENGVLGATKSTGRLLAKAGGKMIGRNLNVRDALEVGILEVGAEFSSGGGMAKAVDLAMRLSGFTTVDRLGKSVMVDSSWQRFTKIAKAGPGDAAYKAMEAEWRPILGDEFEATVADLRQGIVSDNVKLMLFIQVSKVQPITLSEMPVKYLENPDGRLFYMLKTFTLKQLNYMRRQSFDKMAAGQWTEGMQELLRFAMIFMVAGMGVDMLKRWIAGQPIDHEEMPDIVIENALRVMGGSKYMAGQVNTKGPGSAFMALILPPTRWLDDPAKDLGKLPDIMSGEEDPDVIKTYRNLPIVGKIAYYRWGAGAEYMAKERRSRRTKLRTTRFNDAKRAYLTGDVASARAIIQRYNTEERPDDDQTIKKLTMKGVRTSIKREKRKLAESRYEAQRAAEGS